MEHVPVIALNTGNSSSLEKNPGFKLTLPMFNNLMKGLIYGDLLMRVLYRVRPYELVPGSANRLYDAWVKRCQESLKKGSSREYTQSIRQIVKDFDDLKLDEELVKPQGRGCR